MNNKGFILLEVLLSLVILGAVFVVSFQALSGYIRATSSSLNINSAETLLQELTARVSLNEFGGSANGVKTDNNTTLLSWAINETDVSELEKQYEITVSWTEHGQPKYLKSITEKYQPPTNI
jgi:type II secretory pathway pseudopilin PulG